MKQAEQEEVVHPYWEEQEGDISWWLAILIFMGLCVAVPYAVVREWLGDT